MVKGVIAMPMSLPRPNHGQGLALMDMSLVALESAGQNNRAVSVLEAGLIGNS
jgi:hypothetical protein